MNGAILSLINKSIPATSKVKHKCASQQTQVCIFKNIGTEQVVSGMYSHQV